MKGRYGLITLVLKTGEEVDVLVADGVINEMAVDIRIAEGQLKANKIKDTGLVVLTIPVLKIAPAEKWDPWKTLPEKYEAEGGGNAS